MYGNFRNTGIRCIGSYDSALARFNSTAPIKGKGRNAGVVPLGGRDKPHYFMTHNEATGDVSCCLYRTPVVVFHKDNTVTVQAEGYSTQSTANFIGEVLGLYFQASVRDNSIRMVARACGKQYRLDKSGLTFKLDGVPTLISGGDKFEVFAVNRKNMSDARKKYAKFRSYISGVMKLQGGWLDSDHVHEAIGTDIIGASKRWQLETSLWRENASDVAGRFHHCLTLVESEDTENWYRAAMWLAVSSRTVFYARALRATAEDILAKFDELIMVLLPDVLDVKHVPAGEFVVNRYSRFAPFKELHKQSGA